VSSSNLKSSLLTQRKSHGSSRFYYVASINGSDLTIDATTIAQQNESLEDPSLAGLRHDHQLTATSGTNPLETMMHLGVEDFDMFDLFSSEMYNPGIFEGLDRSSTDMSGSPTTHWEHALRST